MYLKRALPYKIRYDKPEESHGCSNGTSILYHRHRKYGNAVCEQRTWKHIYLRLYGRYAYQAVPYVSFRCHCHCRINFLQPELRCRQSDTNLGGAKKRCIDRRQLRTYIRTYTYLLWKNFITFIYKSKCLRCARCIWQISCLSRVFLLGTRNTQCMPNECAGAWLRRTRRIFRCS